jgi:ElaB/YqjD/DUF883 family membrane-anchored ribosome-binding protein
MGNENQAGHGPAAAPQTGETAGHGGTQPPKAAEDLHSVAGATAEEYLGRAERVWDDTVDQVRSFQDEGKQYVRENPTKAVFVALGVGFVLGLIFRR